MSASLEGRCCPSPIAHRPSLVELLNGNVVIETSFYDGELLISKCLVRVWYE